MKFRPFNLNNSVLVLSTIVMLSIVIRDLASMIKHHRDNVLMANYVAFEKENIRNLQLKSIERIDNTISFRRNHWGNYFEAFRNLEVMSLVDLEENLILLLDPEISSLDELDYFNQEIKDARKRMNEAKNDDIRSLYESLLFSAMLDLLESNVNRYPCLMYINQYQIVRPITEDSVYIGGLAFYPERIKNAFSINGHYFDEQSDEYYQIPAADTVHILSIEIENNRRSLDTMVTSQTITKVDGRWWNIGGRKEGA